MPPGVDHALVPWFDALPTGASLTPRQAKVVQLLGINGPMSLPQLQEATGSTLTSIIPDLEGLRAIRRTYRSSIQTHGVRTERWISARPDTHLAKLTPRQREVLGIVTASGPDGMRTAELTDRTGVSASVIERLQTMDLVAIADRPLAPRTDVEPVGSIPTLTDEQASVWSHLERDLASPSKPQLLFGITGSGKTELYLRAIATTLRRGKSAIVLVPESSSPGKSLAVSASASLVASPSSTAP